MQVRDGMSKVVLTVGPGPHSAGRGQGDGRAKTGAAIVVDPDQPGPGIITERDLLESMGADQNLDEERVADHLSSNLTFAAPDWSLERAAEAMVRGGFRHLVVVDGGDLIGVLSMRDIVRCWVSEGATSEMPGPAAEATSTSLA